MHTIIAAIPMVFAPSGDPERPMSCGDLLLTPDTLYYVPYHRFGNPSNAAMGAAAVLGGPALMAALQRTSGTSRSDLSIAVASQREAEWGLSLERRLAGKPHALKIPRISVTDLNLIDGGVLEIVMTNASAHLRIDSEADAKYVIGWLSGKFAPRPVRYESYGFGSEGLPAPGEFVVGLSTGDGQLPNSDKLADASLVTPLYLTKILAELAARGPSASSAISRLGALPTGFIEALVKQAIVKRIHHRIIIGICAPIVIAAYAAAIYLALPDAMNGDIGSAAGTILLLPLLIIAAPAIIWLENSKRLSVCNKIIQKYNRVSTANT